MCNAQSVKIIIKNHDVPTCTFRKFWGNTSNCTCQWLGCMSTAVKCLQPCKFYSTFKSTSQLKVYLLLPHTFCCFSSVVKARNLLHNFLYHLFLQKVLQVFASKSCKFWVKKAVVGLEFCVWIMWKELNVLLNILIGFFISPLGADVRRAWQAS